MSRKAMSIVLKFILFVLLAIMSLFFFVFLGFYGSEFARVYSEYSRAFYPCLIWAWLFALPLYVAVAFMWKIVGTISVKGGAFSKKNAARFKAIALCSFLAPLIFFVGMIVVAFMGAGSPVLTLVVCPLVIVFFNAFGFVCYVVSRLVGDSAEMKEENDLTV